MKITKKIVCVLLCCMMIVSLFSGCSDGGDNINFIYPFSANVKSYDPQVAGTADEFLIIENTFEGLIRIDDDGTVKKGVADKWAVSADKLTYTFNLKKGMKWDIKTDKNDKGEYKDERLAMLKREFNPDITANDFVFALKRAVMPETSCPLFANIAAIKNAEAIHNGEMELETLGVKAVDNYTLVITLERPDEGFMQALTTAPAMPCNEEFFNATNGRYGLATKYTLFNGQFYLDQILEASYLLKQNDMYKGDSPSIAKELTFKIPGKDETDADKLNKLESGYYDAAFIRGDESEKLRRKDEITYVPFVDTTWAFLLNPNNEIMQSKKMRKAFCQGFSRNTKLDKEYLSTAYNLVPSSCMIGANKATKAMGATVIEQNAEESVQNWQEALKVLEQNNIDISIITVDYMAPYAKKMLQGIQGGIGTSLKTEDGDTISLSLKVETVSEYELKEKVTLGDYTIALYPFESTSTSALAFLNTFVANNVAGIGIVNAESALEDAAKQKDMTTTAKYMRQAEQAIMLSYSVCPVIYETSYYVAAKGVKNIQFHAGTGRIDFTNATRID